VADASIHGLQGLGEGWPAARAVDRSGDGSDPSWWLAEPDVGRVADGVAARVDRLKAIGNGQVPLVAATAWRLLTS
jgi:DNA (cytosine-5)-methyltransferase 1